MFRFFPKMSMDVCVATFVSIQTNFKPDLISFHVQVKYMVKW